MGFNEDMIALGHLVITSPYRVLADKEGNALFGLDDDGEPVEQTDTTYYPADKTIVEMEIADGREKVKRDKDGKPVKLGKEKNKDVIYVGDTLEEIKLKIKDKVK